MNKNMEVIPNSRLREARLERHWSQLELADSIGTTRVTVSRWERRSMEPGPYFRLRLCELFGKNAQELGLMQEDESKESVDIATSQAPAPNADISSCNTSPSPPLWNVPYWRNPFFTGRETLLTRLATALQRNQEAVLTQAQAISGLGGVGKTQVAVEYAYRFHSHYHAIFWVRADTREAMVSGFVAIAELLNLPEHHEQDETKVLAAVKNWLRTHADWLLILDNLDDLMLMKEFLPSVLAGHSLFTTHAQMMGSLAQSIEVESMDDEEGTLFLLHRAGLHASSAPLASLPAADIALAREIVQEMHGLPLALDQAGAYIEETACSLADYLKLYRTQRATLLQRRGNMVVDHPDSVATTWSLSFAQVQQQNAFTVDLLRLCAFLHPDAIPEEIITTGMHHSDSVLHSLATNPYQFDATIATLRAYSLVRRDTSHKTLAMHRLVQTVLKDAMEQETSWHWAQQAVQAVNATFPEVMFDTWPRCERLLPHALESVGHLERLMQSKPIDSRMLAMATLLVKTAQYLTNRARYGEAEPLYQRALYILEQLRGPEHLDMVPPLNSLAVLYREQGKYTQAEVLLERALHILQQRLEPEHPNQVEPLASLANIYYAQGKYVQAEPLLERALHIWEMHQSSGHPNLVPPLNDLAMLYRTQGKYAQAEPLLQRAVLFWEMSLGPNHPKITSPLINLGILYHEQGKYTQAEVLLERALHIREQSLGPEHPNVAYPLNDLAEIYREQGKYTQAEMLNKRALTILERQLGPEHPVTVALLESYADLLRQMHREDEAATLRVRTQQEVV